jgi:NifB/MoaA-like Fe-S oxidoreductase
MLDAVHAWQLSLRGRIGVRFAHATDEWYLMSGRPVPNKRDYEGLALQENGLGMTRDFLDEWARLKRTDLRRRKADDGKLSSVVRRPSSTFKYASAVLATAALFAPTLRKAAAEFARLSGARVDVIAVNNNRLGETITVAGLLMGRDVIEQLSPEVMGCAQITVLPRIMFDHPEGVSLDDLSPMDIARAIGKPVALADWMGDVLDALAGRNALTYDPASPGLNAPSARQGGWTVEKYL